MKKETVSLCMIVKDEEASLPRCLNSIKDFVDEIIVVDTGSRDRSKEVAQAYGARVLEEPWQNNFSQARNVGLEQARGDWILFLDADEEALPEHLACLRDLAHTDMEGFFLQVLNFDDQGNCIRQPALRLFRNRPQYRFKGAIHEQIIDSILEHNPRAKFGVLDIKIKHWGYQDKLVDYKNKIQRNLAILQEQYDKGDKNGFLLFNLATEYLRSGDLAQALKYYNEAECLTSPALSFAPLLGKKKIQTLMLLNDYQAALDALHRYLELYPDYTDLVFLKATLYYCLARFPEALELYKTCLAIGEAPRYYVSESGVGSHKAKRGIKELTAILERLQNRPAPKPGLSLCMIVCDEEKNLARCLNSVKGVVNEIIIVDTGSRDRTREVARAYGAEVFEFPWVNDFALARNFSLRLAGHEWILVLDADETLRPEEHEKLRQVMAAAGHLQGFYLKVVNYFGQGDPDDFVIDAVCRIFRNRPEFRFSGPVHEEITQSIIDHSGPGSIAPAEIHIDHWGYLKAAALKIKGHRNIALLHSRLSLEPLDGYALYALGVELFQEGRFDTALEQFSKAQELLEHSGVLPDLYFKIAACHLELKQFQKGLRVVQKAQELFPDFTSLWYIQGLMEFQQGNLPEACQALRIALELGDPPWYRYTFPHGIGSFRAAVALAQCLEKMGLLEEAEELLAHYLTKRQGLGTLVLPFCRLVLNRYGPEECLQKIEGLNLPSCFRESLLLAEAFERLERPDLAQIFVRRCKDFLREIPSEPQFFQLAGIQLGLAGKYCARGLEVGPSPVLCGVQERIKALLQKEG